jgi:adenylate cyclase
MLIPLSEGSVLHAGNHIRITAQLIQAEPEEHLWARDYDCEIGDALEVQAQVARAVAESIHASLTPQDIARLSRKIPGNPDTLRAYLKARFLIMTWNQADVQTGFQYLNEVIQKSPGFALAYELLASCLFALGFWGYLPPRVVYPQARAAAMKAVELDDLLCEAHATLGLANLVMDWDAAACERELERAVEINPSNDAVRLSCALYLVTMSRKREEALKQAKLGLEANPLSEHTNFSYAWILLFAGEYDSAREHALKTMDMYRNSLQLYFILGWAHLGRARVTDAVEAFEKAVAISRDTVGLGYLGHAYGLAGRRDEALAALQEMLERSEREEVPLTSLALIHIGLGDFDKALDLFDKCFEERDGRLFWLPLTIFCDTFCADPRYQQLLQRMKAAAERSSIA